MLACSGFDRRHSASGARQPLWIDVCVLHRKCGRILTGVVVQRACVHGMDCRPHYHLVDFNDDLTLDLTWRDVARHRRQELVQLQLTKPRGVSLLGATAAAPAATGVPIYSRE